MKNLSASNSKYVCTVSDYIGCHRPRHTGSPTQRDSYAVQVSLAVSYRDRACRTTDGAVIPDVCAFLQSIIQANVECVKVLVVDEVLDVIQLVGAENAEQCGTLGEA